MVSNKANAMNLTDEQIETLFRFCQKKYVHWYDLQIELVDHLAERIEEEMAANNKLTFEAALQKVYAGFGLFGFAHIVQHKEKALQRRHNRAWWRAVKAFFTLPKLALTAALFAALYTFGQWIATDVRMFVVCLFWVGGYVFEIVQLRRVKKPMVRSLLLTQYGSANLFVAPVVFSNLLVADADSSLSLLAFVLLCLWAVIEHSASIEVTGKIYREARRLYPKAFVTG